MDRFAASTKALDEHSWYRTQFENSKKEILTMQQWNEHKKSATHQSLPEFICNYLKFNVVAMNIKLKPAAQDTVSANMASPIGPSTMPQATNVQLDVFVLEQPTEEIHAKAE